MVRLELKLLLLLLSLFLAPLQALSRTEIDTSFVRKRILESNLQVKRNKFHSEKNILELQLARSVYDWKSNVYYRYRNNQENSLNSFFYDQSKTKSWGFSLEKKVVTGATFFGDFSRIQQMATTSSEIPIPLSEERFEYQGSLKIKQPIWRNVFGSGDRNHIGSVKENLKAAKLEQKQNLEHLLANGLKLYWNTYTAQQELITHKAIREEYAHLISIIKRKNTLGFSDIVDLEKAQAEFLNQSREVEYAQAAYDATKIELLRFLNVPSEQDIVIKVEDNTPKPPKKEDFAHVDWKNSHAIKIAETQLMAAKLSDKATKLMTLPELNIVASYRSATSGEEPSEVFRQFRQREYPDYTVGVEFRWNFWSKADRAKRAYGRVLLQDRELALREAKEKKQDEITKAWSNLEKTYRAAISNQKELQVRTSVIERQKKSFQQGRLDTSQLIIDYNALFFSRLRYAQAVRNYNLALVHLRLTLNTLLLPTDSTKDGISL